MFLQQLVNGLTLGSLYAVLAIGLTLVFGVLNIINMAHGGIFMIGAFVGLFMVTIFNVNIFVALIVAMAVGAILGYLLEFVALRPLRKKKVSHLAPLISTIGVPSLLKAWHYCFGVLKQDLSHQIILVVLSTLELLKFPWYKSLA